MSKYNELREKRNSANEKLGDIYMKAANRELTTEEKMEVENLSREIKQCEDTMRGLLLDAQNAEVQKAQRSNNLDATFRSILHDAREAKSTRTILLNAASGNTNGNITASGAIELNIHDLIPTLNEGLGLPVGLSIVTGVVGNEVWPVSINDVEMEEKGEIETLSEQTLEFDKITPTPKRLGLCVPISNMAIDNAAFDLMSFVQTKFTNALRKYLAKKIYSQAAWQGNHGPFSGATAVNLALSTNAYKNILDAVAAFSDKGLDEDTVCLSMSRATEALLKATPKADGQGGFIIENGLCAGYPYTVSHFVNTTLNAQQALVPTEDKYIEIGYWGWFALQQHGEVRLTIDATSAAVAKDNVTKVVLNTAWSMTDLSTHINGQTGSQAFGLFKIV